MHFGNGKWFFRVLACVVFVCASGAPGNPALAQQSTTPSSPVPVPPQPSLTQDTDPVPSPDAAPGAPAAAGQNPARTAPQNQVQPGGAVYTFRTNVNEVVLYATVVDEHQHLVKSLTKEDFTVDEDSVKQTISSFRQEDVPISLAILIDNSGSMREKRSAVNTAALDLVRASNPQDQSFIVNFSDEAYLDQDFTSNVSLLEKGLDHIDSKGGTALYDAVVAAADHLGKDTSRPKQAILIITDGEDNSSSTTLQETVRRIQDLDGPVVYSIGLLYDAQDGREEHRARKALQLLSDQTGGLAFFPKSLNQVDAVAQEVAQDIRSQYIIGYHPTKPISQGGYRVISVSAKAKGFGKLIVRTRAGYFAQPQHRPPSSIKPGGQLPAPAAAGPQ